MRRSKVLGFVNDGALIAVRFMGACFKKFKRIEYDSEAFGLLIAAYDMEYVTGRIFREKRFEYDVVKETRNGLLTIIPKGFAKNSEYTEESIIEYFEAFVRDARADLMHVGDDGKVTRDMLQRFNKSLMEEVITDFGDNKPVDFLNAMGDRLIKRLSNEKKMWKKLTID